MHATLMQTLLHSSLHLISVRNRREHAKTMLERRRMRLHARGGRTVLQRENVVPVLVSSSHRALDATVRQKSPEDHILYSLLTQDEVQVGREETTEAELSFNDHILLWIGRHGGMELGAEGAALETLPRLNPREDACRGPDLSVTLLEHDGNVHDQASLVA